MNLRTVISTSFLLLLLTACNKPDINNERQVNKLTAFDVNVIERTPAAAIIQWDSSSNEASNDLVRYRVYLGNIKIKDSLIRFITIAAFMKSRSATPVLYSLS